MTAAPECTPFHASVDPARFGFAAQFVGTTLNRPALRGVLIEPLTGGGVLMVAINGVTLAALQDPYGAASGSAVIRAAKPFLTAAARALKRPRTDAAQRLTIRSDGETPQAVRLAVEPHMGDETDIIGAGHRIVEAEFPQWRGFLNPGIATGRGGAVKPAMLTEIVRAGVTWLHADKGSALWLSGPDDGANRVHASWLAADTSLVVVMPMRIDREPVAVPAWAAPHPDAAETEQAAP